MLNYLLENAVKVPKAFLFRISSGEQQYLTYNECFEFMKNCKRKLYFLQFVPEHLITKELCKLALSRNGEELRDVPYALFTQELCEIAVANDAMALRFVPEELRTKQLCIIAATKGACIQDNSGHKVYKWKFLYFVPLEFRKQIDDCAYKTCFPDQIHN